MRNPLVILALLVMAWLAWSEFGPRGSLPTAGGGGSSFGSSGGPKPPAAPTIVNRGVGDAARQVGN